MGRMQPWRLRQIANIVNLSTPLGLLVGLVGQARPTRGPRGLIIAEDYRLKIPPNPAFTVGNVVLCRHSADWLTDRPKLLQHEERHARQWTICLGLPFIPLYGLGALWSWWRTGNVGAGNPWERWAGLTDGGYAT